MKPTPTVGCRRPPARRLPVLCGLLGKPRLRPGLQADPRRARPHLPALHRHPGDERQVRVNLNGAGRRLREKGLIMRSSRPVRRPRSSRSCERASRTCATASWRRPPANKAPGGERVAARLRIPPLRGTMAKCGGRGWIGAPPADREPLRQWQPLEPACVFRSSSGSSPTTTA
jgi:hypothetical protein